MTRVAPRLSLRGAAWSGFPAPSRETTGGAAPVGSQLTQATIVGVILVMHSDRVVVKLLPGSWPVFEDFHPCQFFRITGHPLLSVQASHRVFKE